VVAQLCGILARLWAAMASNEGERLGFRVKVSSK
jgi:hypothetical protein